MKRVLPYGRDNILAKAVWFSIQKSILCVLKLISQALWGTEKSIHGEM
jgi:hypothetical protein